jgi:spoIIIJ-associated protein
MSQRKYTIETHGERIEDFLDMVLDLADWDVDFDLEEGHDPRPEIENPDIVVKFSGPELSVILENKAEVLFALEQLTTEMLRMPHEHHSLLRFDANDMRLLRIEELRASAATAAEKVRKNNAPFRFNPMSSRERRILHLALRSETGIRTESEGMEPRRNLVVYPEGMASQPAPPSFAPRRSPGGGSSRGPGGPGGSRDRGPRRGPGGGRDRDRGPRPPRSGA